MSFFFQIPPSEIYFILFLFSALNYDPPDNEEFFKSCIQHLTSNLSKCNRQRFLLNKNGNRMVLLLIKEKVSMLLLILCLLGLNHDKYSILGFVSPVKSDC